MADNYVTPGVWRHYRGGLYTVLLAALDEGTGEPLVVYVAHATGRVWARKACEWQGQVVLPDGRTARRFEYAG
jgi:hypothetical protein